jgi:hypothetical protein
VGVALQWSWLKVLLIVPLRHDQPLRSHDSVPTAGEGRSDIRAQRADMIPCLSSQNFIRLKKLNDSWRLWVGIVAFE